MKKKSQIQMMETIAIMLIFFVIIVIGFTFYIKTSGFSQGQKITKIQELEYIKVSQAISFLPELQCSSKNIIKDNCFDMFKLSAFINLPDKNNVYYPFLYYSDITVSEIYPSTKSWNIYNRTRNSTSYKTTIPILLYNATERTNSFGILNIKYYTIS